MAGRFGTKLKKYTRFAAWLLTFLYLVGMVAGCASDIPAGTQTMVASAPLLAETQETGSDDSLLAETQGTEPDASPPAENSGQERKDVIAEDGSYTSKEEVALYLHTYGHLPDNYISKKEAQALGWDSKKGNLDEVAPGKSIGGSHYGNYEGQLPKKDGRKYYECDLEYEGGYRGAKRLVYSNDGLVFYTEDHYKTFEQLY